jgi:hypothetical protein
VSSNATQAGIFAVGLLIGVGGTIAVQNILPPQSADAIREAKARADQAEAEAALAKAKARAATHTPGI